LFTPKRINDLAAVLECREAPAKSGERTVLRAKNLAAGVAIPAARSNDDDGANVAHLPKKIKRAAIPIPNKDGERASPNNQKLI
jgi:hypothetical protein